MKTYFKTLFITIFSLFFVMAAVSAEETSPSQSVVSVARLLNNVDQYTGEVTVQGYVNKISEDGRIELTDPHHSHMGAGKKCYGKGYHATGNHAGMKGNDCPKAAAENETPGHAIKCPMSDKTKCPVADRKDCKKSGGETCADDMAKACKKGAVKQSLTVLWKGVMPDLSVPVSAVGKLAQKDGQLVFEATSLQVLN